MIHGYSFEVLSDGVYPNFWKELASTGRPFVVSQSVNGNLDIAIIADSAETMVTSERLQGRVPFEAWLLDTMGEDDISVFRD